VWAFSWRLDEALANGTDPNRDALLACRAEHLVSGRARHELAEGLKDAIEQSIRPSAWTSAAPLATASVGANSSRLLALAARLESEPAIDPRGAAKVQLLLTDGCSPLYRPGTPLALEGAVEAALVAL
jgi:hypothetical protein